MNKIILMGNLTRDPEISYAQSSNMAIARFGLAVNRRLQRDGETETEFFNCTAFGKSAEFVEKYFHKGSRMLLTGRVQNDNYTNKNGEKVYTVQIIAEDIEFAERKAAADQAAGSSYGGSTPPAPADADGGSDFMPVPDGVDDDIPF